MHFNHKWFACSMDLRRYLLSIQALGLGYFVLCNLGQIKMAFLEMSHRNILTIKGQYECCRSHSESSIDIVPVSGFHKEQSLPSLSPFWISTNNCSISSFFSRCTSSKEKLHLFLCQWLETAAYLSWATWKILGKKKKYLKQFLSEISVLV